MPLNQEVDQKAVDSLSEIVHLEDQSLKDLEEARDDCQFNSVVGIFCDLLEE